MAEDVTAESAQIIDLGAGRPFKFTSVGDATLKGFDEPVALYEVWTR